MTEVIRDEEVRRRIRLAQEFLDPGMHSPCLQAVRPLTIVQMMCLNEGKAATADGKQSAH
jgi:hypothetical protein